jgi:signal transduction histidine kinase
MGSPHRYHLYRIRLQRESDRKEILQLQPILETSRLRLGYRGEGELVTEAGEFEFRRRALGAAEIVRQFKLSPNDQNDVADLEYEVTEKPVDPNPVYLPFLAQGEIIGAYLDHFVPRAILSRYDHVEEEPKQIVSAFLNRSESSNRMSVGDETFTKLPDPFKDILYAVCTEAEATISLVIEMNPPTIIFSDNGRGIAPENREKVFRPFWFGFTLLTNLGPNVGPNTPNTS